MCRRTIAFALAALVVLPWPHRVEAGGQMSTPLQVQSIPMTQTDWGPGTPGVTDPLTYAQFNPALGRLDSVALTLTSTIHSDFELVFPATPTPTTLYVATTSTSDPSILSDPSLVRRLTDGPTVTLLGPDGVTPLFGAPGTRLPVDVVSLTESSGTWSSRLPVTDPRYIPPDEATLSLARTLDSSNGSLLSQFLGTGRIELPITAIAYSSFYSSSGNGAGMVLTAADATVTVQYQYTPFAAAAVPEPSGLALLGLGAGLCLVGAGATRRHGSAG
jgi:hypothetical protein